MKKAPLGTPKTLCKKGIAADGELVRILIDRQTLSVTPPRLRELRVPPLPQGEALYYICSAMKRLPVGGCRRRRLRGDKTNSMSVILIYRALCSHILVGDGAYDVPKTIELCIVRGNAQLFVWSFCQMNITKCLWRDVEGAVPYTIHASRAINPNFDLRGSLNFDVIP